jgi:hypothetical protein
MNNVVMIKMPFLRWKVVHEEEVPFLFKIMTLELICEYFKIPIEELFEEKTVNHENMSLALVWCGYIAACKDLYKKPRYTVKDAKRWDEYMPKSSRDMIGLEVAKLFGNISKSDKKIEDSEKKK